MSLKKAGRFGGGFVVFKATNFVFYTLITPAIVNWLDNQFLSGVTIMLLIAIRSILLIRVYDRLKKDLFLLEERKKKRQERLQAHPVAKKHPVKKATKASMDALVFLFWVSWDPAITILFYRRGFHLFNGIPSQKIKLLFGFSTVASTLVWVFLLGILIQAWGYLFGILKLLIYIIFY